MRLLIRLLAVGLVCLSTAASGFWQSRDSNYNVSVSAGGGSFTPSCTQSGNFLARTSGMSNTVKTAYDTMICGLRTDGVIGSTSDMGASSGCGTNLDIFYITVGSTNTNAQLNLCGTSYTLVESGVGYSSTVGYTGDGATAYILVGPNLAGTYKPGNAGNTCGNGAVTCNSSMSLSTSSCGMYVGGSRTTFNTTWINWGGIDSGTDNRLFVYSNIIGTTGIYSLNTTSAQNSNGFNNPSAPGFWIADRVTSGSVTLRQYAAGGTGTPPVYNSNDSTSNNFLGITQGITLLAYNNNGTITSWTPASDPMQAFFCGNHMSTTLQDAMATRVNQFMIDVGAAYHY